MNIVIALLVVLSVLTVPIALLLYLSSLLFKWSGIRRWSKWSVLSGVAVIVICFLVDPSRKTDAAAEMPRKSAETAQISAVSQVAAIPATDNNSKAAAPPTAAPPSAQRPAYCFGSGTERLPECGWTEGKEAGNIEAGRLKISPACKQTEDGIRELWNATIWDHQLHRIRDDDEHTRVVADLVRSAETLCQESRDRKPRQLPAELQKLAR
jgi:hypothetical protein